MDPAEEIVRLWLQQKGFFLRSGVKSQGGKEIDFLAINPAENTRVHVEVHVGVFPLGPLRPWNPAKYGEWPLDKRVRLFYNKKFVGSLPEKAEKLRNRCVEKTVKEILGKNYEKWLVLGTLHRRDNEDELKREFKRYGVKVFFMREILKDIRFKGASSDSTGRFIQILASQLTDEAKLVLLGE
jgi:hypothetical protein